MKACRKYLDSEIEIVKPKYILALGRIASKALIRKAKITQVHGDFIEKDGQVIMPAFHPAYALRDPSKLPPLQHDLERLARALKGEKLQSEIEWKIVTPKTFDRFIAELRATEQFSFDCETSSLHWFKPDFRIRCINFGLDHTSWVLHLDVIGSPLYTRFEAQQRILRVIAELLKEKTSIAQNGKFDNLCLYSRYGIRFPLDFDVMLASHLCNENEPHDLEYLSRVYLDAPSYDIPLKEKTTEHPSARRDEYGAKDGRYTYDLKGVFAKTLRENRELRRLFYELVMPAARAMEDVEREGITIDLPQMVETGAEIAAARVLVLAELQKLAGREINWNAPAQIADLFYGDFKLPVTVRTDKGAPSTGEAALVDLKGKHPIISLLIKYREYEKFLSTYIDGWQEYIVNGKLHLGYKLHGTVTGRWSSRLHQVPRDGQIRSLAIAPPGWEFGQADLSQAELRIAAELSGDVELCSCFRPGGEDVHWRTLRYMIGAGTSGEYAKPAIETAAKLAKVKSIGLSDALEVLREHRHDEAIEIWKPWKEARKKAKAVNFGFVFGMYEKKFIETAKTKYDWEPTYDEAHAFRQAYFELYHDIPAWHERQKKLAHLNGGVRNLFGRLRRLPGIHSSDREIRSEAERQAINSPVQGAIGDWKAASLVEICETLPRDRIRIVGEHHDAILFIVRKDPKIQARVLPALREIMRKPKLLEGFKIRMSVPMESEIELGPWGSGKPWRG